MEFNRPERKTLRELASEVFEAEACDVLADLAASFAEWRGAMPLRAGQLRRDASAKRVTGQLCASGVWFVHAHGRRGPSLSEAMAALLE